MSSKKISLGKLSDYPTGDGSFSLHSDRFNEAFHCSTGALKEAKGRYIYPAQISRFKKSRELNVLDVCFGLGYNSGCLLEELVDTSISLKLYGLELDKRPLRIALKNTNFQKCWSQQTIQILSSINISGRWKTNQSEGVILWGDAREELNHLPKGKGFKLIFLDAFSPSNCPQLWTEEFIQRLANQLAPGGMLITYCRAAAVRGSLIRAGLELRSVTPTLAKGETWSSGTVAILPDDQENIGNLNPYCQKLSRREEEHLLTRASIPYRDPTGKADAESILRRRKEEQDLCSLERTISWQKRWIAPNST